MSKTIVSVISEQTKSMEEGKPKIEGLRKFLTKIGIPEDQLQLSKSENQYLTGGWFEEYTYHIIKKSVNPNDIILGPKTQSTNNDLDVVFTLGNKL